MREEKRNTKSTLIIAICVMALGLFAGQFVPVHADTDTRYAIQIRGVTYDGDGPCWISHTDQVRIVASSGYLVKLREADTYENQIAFPVGTSDFSFYIGKETNLSEQPTEIDLSQIIKLDTDAPTGAIRLDQGNIEYDRFHGNTVYSLRLKGGVSATIIATDRSSGVKITEYYIDKTGALDNMTEGEIAAMGFSWLPYTGAVVLPMDCNCVFYGRVTDNVGNVVYFNTEGLILESDGTGNGSGVIEDGNKNGPSGTGARQSSDVQNESQTGRADTGDTANPVFWFIAAGAAMLCGLTATLRREPRKK